MSSGLNGEERILSRSGDWVFDQAVAAVFDRHVRKSIPCYDILQDFIASLSRECLADNALVYDLGTATGEIISRIHRCNPGKHVRYIGIDISGPMLKAAVEKCRHIPQASFHRGDIAEVDYGASDLVVAAFTLQFMPRARRHVAVKRVRNALKPDGTFILCEKIRFENADLNDAVIRVHERWKSQHFTRREIEAKKISLRRVMKPFTVSENVELLLNAGFRWGQPVFQWGNFVCLVAR